MLHLHKKEFYLFLLLSLLTACGNSVTMAVPTNSPTLTPAGKPPVVIGSMLFTENILTAEIYAQALEKAGIPIKRNFNFGTTVKLEPATAKGEIDLYPDYTGNALAYLQLVRKSNSPQDVYNQVVKGYAKDNLTMLNPAPMNDTYAMAVSRATAEKYHLSTISDLAKVAPQLSLISVDEWDVTRTTTDGFEAFKKVYNILGFKEITEVSEMDRYTAFLQGKGDVILAYTTDGEISGDNLVLLDDDKHFFPPYQLIPVVRNDILADYPNITNILNKISLNLTTSKITAMNWLIDGPAKQNYTAVAKEFLDSLSVTGG